jgi:hypothetical protein
MVVPGIDKLEKFVSFISPAAESYPKMLRWHQEEGEFIIRT